MHALRAGDAECENACQRAFEWSRRSQSIESAGQIVNGSIRAARRFVLEKQGWSCALCATTQWQGKPMPLVLDHINGDASDWRVSNLRYICPNCDAQLPTFKSRNRGKGRAVRRQRYAMGLSY
jgi:hypothetical protein